MATNISSDISTNINITIRKNDSLYLKITLTNSDGTAFNVSSYTVFKLEVFDSKNTVIKRYQKTGVAATGTSEVAKPATITVYNDANSLSPGEIILDSPSFTVNTNTNKMFFNNNLLVGSYDYKFIINNSTETHTILHGKIKCID